VAYHTGHQTSIVVIWLVICRLGNELYYYIR